MAIIRAKELRMMNKEELLGKLKELELEWLKIKAQKGQATTGGKKSKEIKRTIARINTQLKSKTK